jgi:signal transduction histidine kinase
MPEEVALLIFVGMVGGFSLTGLSMILKARRSRHGDLKHEDVERLAESVEGLQDQMFQMRDAVADLHERVDFAERLLTKGEKQGGAS